MFTNQYILYRKMMFKGGTAPMIMSDGSTVTVGAHNTYNADFGAKMHYGLTGSPTGTNTGVFFCSGSTPPQKTDYTLESLITSGLSITNQSGVSYEDMGDGKWRCEASYILKNTSDAVITISEIGYFANMGSVEALFERTVLDTPITIPVGESRLVTYRLNFNHG